MRWILPLCLLALPVCAGCGNSPMAERMAPVARTEGKQRDAAQEELAKAAAMAKKWTGNAEEFVLQKGQGPNAPNQPVKGVEPEPKKEKQRKIRYTADMRLIVEDLDKAIEELDAARKEATGGYAKVEINTSAAAVRSGMWRVRVPVDNLYSFRKAVAKLGEVERDTLDSEDMTGQYYDLKADIENRKSAREALRELLKETGKKEMKHYLEVWDKLESVSGEINRKEGQLKLWEDLTDLTTITVNLREKQKYIAVKPPDTAEVPTFGMRADKAWNDSWDALVGFLEWAALVAIAVTPWLPIPMILGAGVWLIARRLFRRKPEQVVVLVEAQAKNA